MNRTKRRVVIAAGSVALLAAIAGTGWGISAVGAAGGAQDVTCHIDDQNVLSCPLPPPVTETTTATETQTTTETATETQTVPGPTTTETQTVTVTPTPPPGNGFPNAGQSRNATNTGIKGAGVDPASLTPSPGISYGAGASGQTISGKAYTGTVTISGNNITLKNCTVTYGGLDTFGINIFGDNVTVDHCTVTAPAGKSLYEPVFVQPSADGAVVSNNDLSRGAQAITTYGTHVTIQGNYTHDTSTASDSTQHPDGIEVYGGSNIVIQGNRIEEDNPYDAPINVAPWGGYKVQGLTVADNFLDNGQSIILLDNQNGSCTGATGDCLINTRVLRNAMGGHQCPASNQYCFHIYHPVLLYEARSFVETDAALASNPNNVLWPTSGPDVNRWEESADLTPNLNDQVVKPTCPGNPC